MKWKEKKHILAYLRKHRINASLPTVVRFKMASGEFASFNARTGRYIVKWDHILKAFRGNFK